MCRIPANQKHVKGIMADDYWQEQPELDDSASQWHGKTTPEGFPSTQVLSTKLRDRQRNDVKKREKREKVWDWVNSVYPCHMSLVNQFPHCSLFAANSLSDTKTMNTHTRHTHCFCDLGRQRTHVKQKVTENVCCRLSVHWGCLSTVQLIHSRKMKQCFYSALMHQLPKQRQTHAAHSFVLGLCVVLTHMMAH